ncbi:MAG: hypothetical protein IMX01_00335 [Limnochordaceae bacterium]|nr:hypothetical protein [Limnochordaceae bacterium]
MRRTKLTPWLALSGLLVALTATSVAWAATGASSSPSTSKSSTTTSSSTTTATSPAGESNSTSGKATPPEANLPGMPQQPSAEQLQSEGMPAKEKQLVYSLSPWTGKTDDPYGGTFVPKQADTFYLVANHDSLVNPVRTEVYFWPITGEYMADWFGYREDVPGKLQILQNGKVIKTLEKVKYAYYYGGENFSDPPRLLIGDEAVKEYDRYNKANDAYYKAVTKYYDDYDKWQQYMNNLIQRVQKTGKPAKQSEIPPAPKQPDPVGFYVTEPADSYLVNLPPGEYQVQAVDPKGAVVAGSQKKLIVIGPRRNGLGYVIVPESKWTVPISSDDETQVLYAWGSRTVYLAAFDEQQYNRYGYTQLTQVHQPLAGKGTETDWEWVHTKERTDVKLQLVRNGDVLQTVVREPFFVKQSPGYALGYQIVPFDPKDPAMQGQKPTLWGFRVTIPEGDGYQIRVIDAQGKVIPGSEREIRSVGQRSPWTLYGLSLIPLALGLVAFGWRRSRRPKAPPVA